MGIAVIPAPGGGVTQKVQEFTSTGTFTAPSNCSAVEVLLVAGGGGGGFASNIGTTNRYCGGGGAGGEVITRMLPVTPGQSYTVTIGAGGAGGTSSTSGGGTGGTTSFGSLLSVFGGRGGQSARPNAGEYSYLQMGGGSAGQNNGAVGGCGGGAGGSAQFLAGLGNTANTLFVSIGIAPDNQRSTGGGTTPAGTTSYVGQMAGIGIQGFGNGGAGGLVWNPNAPNSTSGLTTWSGTGTPGLSNLNDTTRTLPVAASANTGDGGHGAVTAAANNLSTNGSNGGSGYARITFWS